jgi:hypothetical protein
VTSAVKKIPGIRILRKKTSVNNIRLTEDQPKGYAPDKASQHKEGGGLNG